MKKTHCEASWCSGCAWSIAKADAFAEFVSKRCVPEIAPVFLDFHNNSDQVFLRASLVSSGSKPEITSETFEDAEPDVSPCWRNMFSSINLLRILNKLVKWKHSRTMVPERAFSVEIVVVYLRCFVTTVLPNLPWVFGRSVVLLLFWYWGDACSDVGRFQISAHFEESFENPSRHVPAIRAQTTQSANQISRTSLAQK